MMLSMKWLFPARLTYNSDERRLGCQSIYVVDEHRLQVDDGEQINLLLGPEPQY
jgi:hypothetical protein